MKYSLILSFSGLLFLGMANAQVQLPKIDSTLKIDKAGYRVDCKNKSFDQNLVSIRPVGFDNSAREMSFMINGRVGKVQITDLNSDGFPDLVLYIYSDSNAVYASVYVLLSEANKSVTPCMLPDVMMDGKANIGYKGHDQFSIMGNYVQQKFPIYNAGDEKDKPTGGTRAILYQLVPKAEGGFKFNRVKVSNTP